MSSNKNTISLLVNNGRPLRSSSSAHERPLKIVKSRTRVAANTVSPSPAVSSSKPLLKIRLKVPNGKSPVQSRGRITESQLLPTMSSQRSRAPRNGGRGDSHDELNKKEIWEEIRRAVIQVRAGEQEAAAHREKLLATEERLNAKKITTEGLSITDIDEASSQWREGVKIAEQQKARFNEELKTRIELLRDIQRAQEKELEKSIDEGSVTGRGSSSRTSGMEFDGPSDSPVPSPAENRQVRKIGVSRTSSQPPRDGKDSTPSEASERASKPKIVYHQGQEVAFKRKVPNGKAEEQDWIQGRVVRVIGEGKSRRYEVKDPYPDENSGGTNVYKSSASQMVPIPPEGATLGDYEPGRIVLALYPETTTFYRAEVKAMLDGGAQVQLLFEGETDAQLSTVARRFVLDHKG